MNKSGIYFVLTLWFVFGSIHLGHTSPGMYEAAVYHSDSYDFAFSLPAGWKVKTVFDHERSWECAINRRLRIQTPYDQDFMLDIWRLWPDRDAESWIRTFQIPQLMPGTEIPDGPNALIAEGPAWFFQQPPSLTAPGRLTLCFSDETNLYRVEYVVYDGLRAEPEFRALLDSFTVAGSRAEAGLPELSVWEYDEFPRITNCCGYSDPGNRYPCCDNRGNCTWWGSYKRQDFPDDHSWGDAWHWIVSAREEGFHTGDQPAVGAVVCFPRYQCGWGQWGHVAYVESVNGNNYSVSEMGWCSTCGTTSSHGPSSCGQFIYQESYECEAGSQSPAGAFNVEACSTFEVWVEYKNSGYSEWSNNPDSDGYVCLKTRKPDDRTSKLFHDSWLDGTIPCTMEQKTVAHNETARFKFTMFAPPCCTDRNYDEYFGIWHKKAGYLESDPSAHFQVTVTPTDLPSCTITMNKDIYFPTNHMVVDLEVSNPACDYPIVLYIVFGLYNYFEQYYWFLPCCTEDPCEFATFTLTPGGLSHRLLDIEMTLDMPGGIYSWYAAISEQETGIFIGGVAWDSGTYVWLP